MKKNLSIDTRKDAVAIMEKQAETKPAATAEKSVTEILKDFISSETETEIFKTRENIVKNELRKLQAEKYSKLFAPLCESAITNYFAGANEEEIAAEINQFNIDTKNVTLLISDENPEKFGENSVNTYSLENKTYFAYLFAAESPAKAARLVNYWIEYRKNIADSLAAKVAENKAKARKAAKAEKSATELLAEKYGVSVEQLNAILAANLSK